MAARQILLYGANGYTGRLITELASTYQLPLMLAGRNDAAIKTLAALYRFPSTAFDLSDKAALHQQLENVTAVLHVAGPFKHTAKQMIEACIETKTHYLDITGEIEVFELAKQYDKAASAAGVMLMPGAGFDVVPTDCIALFIKNKMPEAVALKLAFATLGGGVSHGTAQTMIEGLGEGGAVRKNGIITKTPLGHKGRWVNFGLKKLFVMSIPWGDVSTAYHTTGIGNIETYTAVRPAVFRLLFFQSVFNWLLKSNWLKQFLKNMLSKRAPGPDAAARKKAKSLVWGEVQDDNGRTLSATLETPDGYTLTAHSSLIIAKKVLAGDFKIGYQTPASAYGEDLILEVPGVKRNE